MTAVRGSRRQVAAANDWARAMLDNGELCPVIGWIGEQAHICRYPANHEGLHYFQLFGAISVPESCGGVVPEPDVAGGAGREG